MSTILFAAFVICLTGIGLSFASIIQPQPKLGVCAAGRFRKG